MVRKDLSSRCARLQALLSNLNSKPYGSLVTRGALGNSETMSKDTKDSSWAISWVAMKVENCLELGMWPCSGVRRYVA